MSIIDNYNLAFINRTHTYYDGQQENIKQALHNVNTPYENNGFLGYFLDILRDPDDIDDVIETINVIISEGFYDPEYNFDIGIRQDLFMEHTDSSVKFYDKFGGDFIQEIPFSDFIEILQLWKTFNQTPPLHNQVL